jgi:hypothetical protein
LDREQEAGRWVAAGQSCDDWSDDDRWGDPDDAINTDRKWTALLEGDDEDRYQQGVIAGDSCAPAPDDPLKPRFVRTARTEPDALAFA